MTHEEAFIQAIRAAADEDAPRLIYADWLEEHGQADRAEFIRIRCQLARLTGTAAEPPGLWLRAVGLLREHWEEWVGPLRDIVGPWRDRYGEGWMGEGGMREKYHAAGWNGFPRGFVERLTLEAADYLRHASTLNRLTPLRELLLWGGGRCMARLAQEPALAGLSALGFTDYYDAPLRASDAALLASSPYLNGLRMLLLGWNSLGDEGVAALVQARWLVSVTLLDLSENGLSDHAAFALAGSPYLTNLRTLRLQRNELSPAGIAALKNSANLPHLVRVECESPRELG